MRGVLKALAAAVADAAGYCPKSEKSAIMDALDRSMDANKSRREQLEVDIGYFRSELEQTKDKLERVLAEAERRRVESKALFDLGISFGELRDCPTAWDQSLGAGSGGMRRSCRCEVDGPKCAYSVCLKGAKLNKFPLT